MNILVADGYAVNPGDLSWESLQKLGDVQVYDRPLDDADAAIRRFSDADVLAVNKQPVTKEILDGCPHLKFITVLATGYNVVDCEAARMRGIPVSNIPAYGTDSVAQYAIALLLEVCQRVGHHSDEVRAGRWSACGSWCFWDYPLIELAGKTMGIIGFGRIGQAVGRIARALNMRVLAYGSRPTEAGRAIADYVDLDTLLASSDVISLHCPLFPETNGIINKNTIAQMKDGVILINNSRGQLIVEQDLADALNAGKVYAAALDVAAAEPIQKDNPLLTAKNCLLTPHISWAPKEARQRILDATTENIAAFLSGKPQNIVNGVC